MNDQRMIGHYRVIELLARGDGTCISLSTHSSSAVAIKSLRPELTQILNSSRAFAPKPRVSRASITQYSDALFVSLDGSDLYMSWSWCADDRSTTFCRPRETSERQAKPRHHRAAATIIIRA